jgi:hypothetical protein
LAPFADQTESSAFLSACVYRYTDEKGIWRGHPEKSIDSIGMFVGSLEQPEVITGNIAAGAYVHWNKRGYHGVLAGRWGADWFTKIPTDLRPPTWLTIAHVGKRLLAALAANAKQGHSLEHAIIHWREAIAARIDPIARRERGGKDPLVPYITPQDVNVLNVSPLAEIQGRANREAFLAEDVKEDTLRFNIVPYGASQEQDTTLKSLPPTRPSKRQKRSYREPKPVLSEAMTKATAHPGQWFLTADLKNKVRRTTGGHLQVEEATDSDRERHFLEQVAEADVDEEIEDQAAASPMPSATSEAIVVDSDEEDEPSSIILVCKAQGLVNDLAVVVHNLPTLGQYRGRARETCDECHQHQVRLLGQVDKLRTDLQKLAKGCKVSWSPSSDPVSVTPIRRVGPIARKRLARRQRQVGYEDSDASDAAPEDEGDSTKEVPCRVGKGGQRTTLRRKAIQIEDSDDDVEGDLDDNLQAEQVEEDIQILLGNSI